MEELVWTYVFNLIVNSFLSFATAALIISLLLFSFRIKNGRIRAILFVVPIVKLCIDPFLYDFGNWALVHQVNPLEMAKGTRQLSISVEVFTPLAKIVFFTDRGQTFTLADIIALSLPSSLVKMFTVGAGGISLILLGGFAIRLWRGARELKGLQQTARCCPRTVENPELKKKLEKVRLVVSESIEGPCAFFRSICFPSKLINHLSQAEFEAIVVHELEHLRWHDAASRLFCCLISTLFWWVPTGWWLKKMEQNQERACDAKVGSYQISPLELASAIVKTAKTGRGLELTAYFKGNGSLAKRLEPLLNESTYGKTYGLRILFAVLMSLIVFFARFWIF